MSSWSKLVALSAREKQLLAAALIVMPITGLALRVMSLSRWRSVLLRLSPVNSASVESNAESPLDHARKTARMVRVAASRGPYRGNCLQQSLAIWWLLRRQKIESEIRFGARREDGNFEAHAWVELLGVPLNDDVDVKNRFAPFEAYVTGVES